MPRRSTRSFTESDKAALLKSIGEARRSCTDAMAKVVPFGDTYKRLIVVTDAIDGLAEDLTGRRDYFLAAVPSTPKGVNSSPAR